MTTNSIQLQERQVVNIADGKCLGMVKDIELNLYTGCIESLILPGLKGFWMRLQHAGELRVPWDKVVCIGEDVILVHMPELSNADSLMHKNKCKRACNEQLAAEVLAYHKRTDLSDSSDESIIILEPDAYRTIEN